MERGGFYQQFGERSGEAQTSKIVPTEQPWYEQDMPYEQLVATLQHFMERARARHFSGHERAGWEVHLERFPTAEWLADELDTQAERSANSDAPPEEQTFFNELKIAWHAYAFPQFGSSLSGIARKEIVEYIQATGSTSITLRPKAVKLFDAMAEVAEIPRKRGEDTVDLTSFVNKDATRIIFFG